MSNAHSPEKSSKENFEAQFSNQFAQFQSGGNNNINAISTDKEKLFEAFLMFQNFLNNGNLNQMKIKQMVPTISPEEKESTGIISEQPVSEPQGISTTTTHENKPIIKKSNYTANPQPEILSLDTFPTTRTSKHNVNFDDMPIKPNNANFLDLLEKNLANLPDEEVNNAAIASENKKKIIKPRYKKVVNISQPSKEVKKYKYYSDNFQETTAISAQPVPNATEEENKRKMKEKIKATEKSIKRKNSIHQPKKEGKEVKNNSMKESKEKEAGEMNEHTKKSSVTYIGKPETNNEKEQSAKESQRTISSPQYETKGKESMFTVSCPVSDEKSIKNFIKNKSSSKKMNWGEAIFEIDDVDQKAEGKDKEITDEENPESINNQLMNKQKEKEKEKEQYKLIEVKLTELNEEISKLKDENNKVSQLRLEYENLTKKLQNDILVFNETKEKDMKEFEEWREEEMKKIKQEKKALSLDKNNSKAVVSQSATSLPNKKEKDTIMLLKAQLNKVQEEAKMKENTSRILIERLKKQLDEASTRISDASRPSTNVNQDRVNANEKKISHSNTNAPSNSLPKAKSKKQLEINTNQMEKEKSKQNLTTKNNNLKDIPKANQCKTVQQKDTPTPSKFLSSEDTENETYDMIFLEKYHPQTNDCKIIKHEKTQDGKLIKIYENDKREVIFSSGVRKEIHADGYQIVYFPNGDLKQIYPSGKSVYYFSEAKTVQTTFPDNLQVFKFDNGQIEKHHPDGTKQISFPDGTLRYILGDGYEETIFPNGTVQKIGKNGVITIEHEDGMREIKYPDGREIVEFPDLNEK